MSLVFGKPRAGSGPQSAPLEVNLAILGRRGAGKSALTVKFLTRRFISEYDPNLEDTYSSEETVDHQPVHLRVMDTADPDTPRNCERYLNWAHAFLVVYSMDSRQSFKDSSSYLELLALHAKETQRSSPALLLGNKLDMAQYSTTSAFPSWDSDIHQMTFDLSSLSPQGHRVLRAESCLLSFHLGWEDTWAPSEGQSAAAQKSLLTICVSSPVRGGWVSGETASPGLSPADGLAAPVLL
ncbi:ras-like protein family member 12 isoform X3 [Callorhinus ursinus]|uniref:ras-like protein family member 12 isoform X3 n=1 Tax=Callorhinus ursinus TaxID=34884 RepID=UPI003CD04472